MVPDGTVLEKIGYQTVIISLRSLSINMIVFLLHSTGGQTNRLGEDREYLSVIHIIIHHNQMEEPIMAELATLVQHADWKSEKHVPVIECPDSVKAEEFFDVKVSLGKEVAHPNTTEHHIRWIEVYFKPKDGNVYDIGRFEFNAHGESVKGANEGPVYTHHEVTASFKTSQAGEIHAMAYCNIHGLWEGSKAINVS